MQDIEVTEVRVKLASEDDEKLLGYCSVTLNNAFVIKDLKIIQGDGSPFIAMPSRKITDKCSRCGYKNHLRAKFCNECGNKLPVNRADTDARGRAKLHFDLVHPIRGEVREYVHRKIVEAYEAEVARVRAGGKPTEMDEG
ncbi:MAG: SpoVG family protein [Planctomycetes bacterium]|nr:SpoVG family protein [Planctomycetota bacterium]MCW8135433.1 SpoVG family protein [Planctomycetota bacterium]